MEDAAFLQLFNLITFLSEMRVVFPVSRQREVGGSFLEGELGHRWIRINKRLGCIIRGQRP